MSPLESSKLIEKIRNVLGGRIDVSITGAELLSCLRSDDLTSAALAEELSSLPQFSERIRPAPSVGDLERAQFDYYVHCIIEDGSRHDAHSRYEAGAEIAALLTRWAREERHESLLYGEHQLAQAYKDAAHPARDAIVLGVLEHVLQTPTLAALFRNWATNPLLARAYEEGLRNSRELGNKH